MDYPKLLCHTLKMHYVLSMYNLRLNYVVMLESVCFVFSHRIWSLPYKYVFVFDHIKEYQLDIVALTETWLSSEDIKTLLINVSLTDTLFIVHLAHLVGEGVEWVYW